jgi:hypothetical protein
MQGTVVSDTESWVTSKWNNRMVQLSVYAGVLFYIVANPAVFKFMESLLPARVTHLNQLLIHAVLFAVLMYVGTSMVVDPLLKEAGLI